MKTEYIIISLYNYRDVINSVNNYIKEGWQPLGGISIALYGEKTVYAQAMIKND